MTIAEVLLADFDSEIHNTRRTLERVPENDPQWTPDPKSMPIGRLAVHTARLPQFCSMILDTQELNLAGHKFPDFIFESRERLLAELDEAAKQARSALSSASDDDLTTEWTLRFGDKVIVRNKKYVLYRSFFLNHLVHHRAQLGVYLRLLKVPVPATYGPSADEQII